MSDRTVLVSGGGIAGAATAFWLARAGWIPTVVERASQLPVGGQVVDIRGVARQVIERMGLASAVERLAVSERGMAYWDRHGRRTVELPTGLLGENGPTAEVEVLREDLAGLLAEQVADVEWVFGDQLTAVEQDVDGVNAQLRHGGERRFDLVVGADGLHSDTRTLVFGPEPRFEEHLGGHVGWFSLPLPEGLDDGWVHLHAMPGGRVLLVRGDREPGRGKAMLMVRFPQVALDRSDVDAQRRWLADRFAGGTWVTDEVVTAMQASEDFRFDALARVSLDRWSAGRVVLVGDAAWCGSPLTGQGTSVALVGAYLLAAALTESPDVLAALADFEQQLRPWIADRQKIPAGGLATMAPRSRLGIDLALLVNRAMAGTPLRRLLPRLTSPADDDLTLPTVATPTVATPLPSQPFTAPHPTS